jgi:hypothetical protein
VFESKVFHGLNRLHLCHVALESVGKTLKAAKNVCKMFALVYESILGVRLTNPWLMAQKNVLWCVHFVCPTLFFLSLNFLGLTVEIASFKLVISHKFSRMDVIKFLITGDVFWNRNVIEIFIITNIGCCGMNEHHICF